MATTIHSNGSGLAQPIEALFDRLATDTLDRTFEMYGNFVEALPPVPGPVCKRVSLFGNFSTYSHVFEIETDDAALIRRLTRAIRANQRTDAYRAQPAPKRGAGPTIAPRR